MRCFGTSYFLCIHGTCYICDSFYQFKLKKKTILDRLTSSPHEALFRLPINFRQQSSFSCLNQVARAIFGFHLELRHPHSLVLTKLQELDSVLIQSLSPYPAKCSSVRIFLALMHGNNSHDILYFFFFLTLPNIHLHYWRSSAMVGFPSGAGRYFDSIR